MAKTLAPAKNSDEIREQLTDREVVKALLSDPEKLTNWVNDSVQARLSSDPALLDQTKEQTEAFMTNWLRDVYSKGEIADISKRLNLDTPNARAKIRPNTIYNKDAIGAEFDGLFETPTKFLHSISNHAFKDDELSNRLSGLKNAMSSIKPSDGGFLIPEVLRADLLRTALEMAVVRSRARVIPMDSLTVPFPTVDSTSNVTSVFGGVTGYWAEEGATLTESKPKFGRVELKANKLTLYTEVPNELLQDSLPSLEAFIGDIFPEAIAWFEDIAFFIGGGVGEPLGFLNALATISVTRSTTVAGTNVEWVDVASMYARMLPQSLNRAVWVVSPSVLPSLLTSQIPGGAPIVVQAPSGFPEGSNAPAMSILGRPLIVSEKARAVGTAGDINFVDFGYYLLGDRQAMSARQSEDFRFNQDVTAFRVTERLDGRPWLSSAITPQNGGDTLSPFVRLTTSV
jgi:HK97 family phage major capsid protein